MVKIIEWEALRKLLLQRSVTLIDVREPAELSLGKIPTSLNVPLSVLPNQLPQQVQDKKTPLVFYCMSGMRSGKAAEWAEQVGGFSDVASYKGSWNEYSQLPEDKKIQQ